MWMLVPCVVTLTVGDASASGDVLTGSEGEGQRGKGKRLWQSFVVFAWRLVGV